ncbi:TPA: hypothetical protein N0F65_006918 [Lagenidium giganteum]|uniref:Uncharacterized protein n=1 Tax=Lagenidium giganteum TaxID=4803 RepID=A0AAV2ZBU4_9STRA|nr:TPA: hypothetical protein N0F65_006918 [Lagenidium giganteum]
MDLQWPALRNILMKGLCCPQNPHRSSARRMLVLLIAALCKCHPVSAVKLLPRILTYISLRLRDKETKVTDACVTLVSALVLHVAPESATKSNAENLQNRSRNDGSGTSGAATETNTLSSFFDQITAPLLKETNAVGESATKCLCAVLSPVDFDGTSTPATKHLLAHAARIQPFYSKWVATLTTRMSGSDIYSTFSPSFLLLHAACSIARSTSGAASGRDSPSAAGSGLHESFLPHIPMIIEAIEDALRYGPREDWVLRKRAIELLTIIMEAFCEDSKAKEFFQSNLERLRQMALTGRQDPVSTVRECAIQTAHAFEAIEKCVKTAGVSTESKDPFAELEAHGDESIPENREPIEVTKKSPDRQQRRKSTSLKKQTKSEKSAPVSPFKQFLKRKPRYGTGLDIPAISPPRPVRTDTQTDEPEAHDENFGEQHGDESFNPSDGDHAEPLPDEQENAIHDHVQDQSLLATSNNRDSAPLTPSEAALEAVTLGDLDLAVRLCIVDDNLTTLRQILGRIRTPTPALLSSSTRNALFVSFLELIDDASDCWLVFPWLEALALDKSCYNGLDPRVLHELGEALLSLSCDPSKQGLAAGRALTQLGL